MITFTEDARTNIYILSYYMINVINISFLFLNNVFNYLSLFLSSLAYCLSIPKNLSYFPINTHYVVYITCVFLWQTTSRINYALSIENKFNFCQVSDWKVSITHSLGSFCWYVLIIICIKLIWLFQIWESKGPVSAIYPVWIFLITFQIGRNNYFY